MLLFLSNFFFFRQENNYFQRQNAILREMIKNGTHRQAERIDSSEDFLALLGNEKEPSLKDDFSAFHLTSGFRFVDLAILRKALEQAQMCGCAARGTL